MNKVLKILIGFDLLSIASFGFVQPIFAIFLKEEIFGGSLASVGLASFIFLITKSLLQPFIGNIADAEKGNKRELHFLFIGALLITLTPLIYFISQNIYHIYFAQFVYGVGTAFSFASWYTLYTRFIDKGKEGYEWSIYDTTTGLVNGFIALIGGVLAQFFGFPILFIIISFFSALSLLMAWFLKRHIDTLQN